MGLFGRKETLNERLMREAGLSPSSAVVQPDTSFLTAAVGSGLTGIARTREWDAFVTVEAPGLAGDAVDFTAVDRENLLVAEEQGDNDLSPLADAVERELEPPYHARGVRQQRDVWAVSASRIEVVHMKAEGDTIEVAVHGGERTAVVDGESALRTFPQLEQLGERAGSDYAVRAERLDGDLWQVQVSAL